MEERLVTVNADREEKAAQRPGAVSNIVAAIIIVQTNVVAFIVVGTGWR
jgi:hypothetical protein